MCQTQQCTLNVCHRVRVTVTSQCYNRSFGNLYLRLNMMYTCCNNNTLR